MKRNFFSITSGNRVEFIFDGISYCHQFARAIQNAQRTIHLQTYIFELGDFGKLVHSELIAAVQRGVKVYMLVDSLGSRKLDRKKISQLVESGVHFAFFNVMQWRWPIQWGRRLHHKILAIDHQYAFVGGINIDRICDHNSVFPRLDFAVFLEGPVVEQIVRYVQRTFRKSGHSKINFIADGTFPATKISKGPSLSPDTTLLHRVGISVNDWRYGYKDINKRYLQMVLEAKVQVTIINSYFFPQKKYMDDLVAAAKRGVKVRLILPRISDWPSYVRASEYLYLYFLKNNVEIYQWTKSILHGKLATIDNEWSTIGSYNLNYMSYLQNLEMNVDVYSPSFTQELNTHIEGIIHTGCEKIEMKDFIHQRSWGTKIICFFLYHLFALISNLSIILNIQEHKRERSRLYQILGITTSLLILLVGFLSLLHVRLAWIIERRLFE